MGFSFQIYNCRLGEPLRGKFFSNNDPHYVRTFDDANISLFKIKGERVDPFCLY